MTAIHGLHAPMNYNFLDTGTRYIYQVNTEIKNLLHLKNEKFGILWNDFMVAFA